MEEFWESNILLSTGNTLKRASSKCLGCISKEDVSNASFREYIMKLLMVVDWYSGNVPCVTSFFSNISLSITILALLNISCISGYPTNSSSILAVFILSFLVCLHMISKVNSFTKLIASRCAYLPNLKPLFLISSKSFRGIFSALGNLTGWLLSL